MARLFISYNRKDSLYAFAIRDWLTREQGWASEDVFFDASHLHTGVDWEQKLLAEAEGAEVMLFLASEHSLNINSFCYRELKHATGQIIAVTVGEVSFDDTRLDAALPHYAKARQVTKLDRNPTEPFPFTSPVDGGTGSIPLNADCVAGIGMTLRELGVAPNSYTWTPRDEGPFPGLRPLMEGDEAIFCGRDLEIRDGLKAIEDLRSTITRKALIIQAPSGAGKSSFLRAGLWRRLRRNPAFTPLAIIRASGGAIRHEEWGLVAGLCDALKPDRSDLGQKLPLSRDEIANHAASGLAGLLASVADADQGEAGRRTLLLGLDQAEEIANLSPEDDAELDALFKTIFHLPEGLDLRLVLTARDDSVDATLRRLERSGLGQDCVETWRLHRLAQSKFDDIITGPAEAANRAEWPLNIDPALVDALANAAGAGADGEGGDALPILALALQRMVAKRRAPDGRVTLEAADAPAFLERAVSDATSDALRAANADAEDLRKLVIPRLATWDPGAGTEGAAKRQVTSEAELFAGERAGLKPLADALVDQRLLTRSHGETGPACEVAHEALLRVPPLGGLIFACREKFEQARILEIETRDWVASGKSESSLVRSGERLKDAFDLMEDRDFGTDLREKDIEGVRAAEYLVACRDHEESREKKSRRVRRTVTTVLSVLTIAALAFSAVALWAVENALKARDAAWKTEGLQALEKASSAPNVYPDRIFYTAKAIGFTGFSGEAEKPYVERVFLRPSFWREAWGLLRGESGDAFPVLVPDELEKAKRDLVETPAYLPFWRSAAYGKSVTGLEVTATHLRAAYEDGKVQQWPLGQTGSEPKFVSEKVAGSVESTGVHFDGTSVKLHAFGLQVDLTCHPSSPTAWVLPEDKQVLYIGMEDGSVIAWDLSGYPVEDRNLGAYITGEWLAFDTGNQKLVGRSAGKVGEFSALPVPLSKPFDPLKKGAFRNSIGMELVSIDSGKFQMGEEGDIHEVTLTKAFWMGAYEVTQQEWQAVMGENPSEFKDLLSPVETVSWNQCQEFCKKLTDRERKAGLPEGWSYVLPTDAEWEYCCRATTTTEYYFGDSLKPDQANFLSRAMGRTVAVGRYEPNQWGLYDMHGNVREWCQDWYGLLGGEPVKDPSGPASGDSRVNRGGCWYDAASFCRSARRLRIIPDGAIYSLGFRVALSSKPSPAGQGKPEANPEPVRADR
ncbi:MAG: SUMF1/EgtB/PvdO family nonheme iron enzyme [Verrucomicrobiales bacterium]|nr:SUMF1/EgtB/PvdO family nonheme iron enzyme [Verrucomicrobiales bacterium]